MGQALRDRFVCGLRNTAAQKRLLSGEDKTDADKLTFKGAIEITSTMEAVETDIQEMNSGRNAEPVLSIQGKPCYHCGKEGHLPRVCQFHDAVCRSCGKKRHIQVVCRSKSSNQRRKAPVKKLKDADNSDEEVDSTDEILGVFKVYARANTVKSAPPPIIAKMRLNGKVLPMEVDTGAALSIISQRKHLGSVRLLPAAL